MKHTKRTFAQSLNTHAYFIARKALWHTKKADVVEPVHANWLELVT